MKYYSEERIADLIKTNYIVHVRSGHHIKLNQIDK